MKSREEFETLFKYTSHSKPSPTAYVCYELGNGEEYIVEGIKKMEVGRRNKPFSCDA